MSAEHGEHCMLDEKGACCIVYYTASGTAAKGGLGGGRERAGGDDGIRAALRGSMASHTWSLPRPMERAAQGCAAEALQADVHRRGGGCADRSDACLETKAKGGRDHPISLRAAVGGV